jgi:hypothetical protein
MMSFLSILLVIAPSLVAKGACSRCAKLARKTETDKAPCNEKSILQSP